MLIEMLTLMINKEIPIDLELIKNTYAIKDYPLVAKIAHKIKGGALYLGTMRMKYACHSVEQYWKSGKRQLFEQLYNQVINTIEETRTHITAWLDKH